MKLWIDAQLSPHLARWIEAGFQIEASPVKRLNLRDATDWQIYTAARHANAVIVTKDADFIDLLRWNGPPPAVIWLTRGNTSNKALKDLFKQRLRQALQFLEKVGRNREHEPRGLG